MNATDLRPVDTRTQARIVAPDIARGMMLLFIALANVSAYLWAQPAGLVSTHLVDQAPLDTALSAIMILVVDGHVYPMFAFLFGYGITQFAVSRISGGTPPSMVGRLLLKRHLWLLAFGAAHALLLFAGDILGAYALTGLALAGVLLRSENKIIRILLWVLGGVIVLFYGFGIAITALIGTLFPFEALGGAALMPDAGNIADQMAGVENYFVAAATRLGLWVTSSLSAVFTLVVPFAVLLGGFAARYRWLENTAPRFSLNRIAIWGILIATACSLPSMLSYVGVWQTNDLLEVSAALLSQLGGIAGGVGYVALFGFIAARIGTDLGVFGRAISAVGKRSLSFYLLQSVIFAPLLSAWGLGLGSQIGSATAYLIAVCVWALSVCLAAWLENSGLRGPAEVLLRRLAFGAKRQ